MNHKSYFLILILLLCTTVAWAQYNQVSDIPYREAAEGYAQERSKILKDHIMRLTGKNSHSNAIVSEGEKPVRIADSYVCFGGKERNILFITASKSVYTLKMLVHGCK